MTESDVAAFREWLHLSEGTDFGACDDQLKAMLERGQVKREVLGYGSAYLMASRWLREAWWEGQSTRKRL